MQETTSFLPEYNVYYERIAPSGDPKGTIVLVHGGAHSGSCYKVTPDGRPGWAYDFAEAGYEVYVLDWPGVGRSGYIDPSKLTGAYVVEAIASLLELIGKKATLFTHSMSGAYGWRLLESKSAQYIERVIAIAPAPMGNIQAVPEIISKSVGHVEAALGPIKYNLSLTDVFTCSKEWCQRKMIGSSKLFPQDSFENYFASVLAIPPRLIYERLNIESSQLKVSEDALKDCKTKVFIVTGTDDADHPQDLDRKVHDFLIQAGVDSRFIWLGDKNILGNGHMIMQETNSKNVSDLIITQLLN
jgi:pimeloyl-ACP methyl ester carboxylesterase